MHEESEVSPTDSPQQRRAQVLQRLRVLAEERQRLDERRRAITDELHILLRRAHDLGCSWEEIASHGGYGSAASARNQALRAGSGPAPPGPQEGEATYTVREAAQILGVTQQAVYDWIKAGRVVVADDRPRNRRVYLPDGVTPPG